MSNRLEQARNKLNHGKTVSCIKNEIRSNFLTRIRRERASSFDKYRKILEDESGFSLKDLHDVLRTDPNITALLEFNEINEIFQLTQAEVQQHELEHEHQLYINALERENEALVALNECQICGKQTENFMCRDCVNDLISN